MQSLDLLRDPGQPPEVRAAAARALAATNEPKVLEALADAMEVSNEQLRDACREALRQLGAAAFFRTRLTDAAPARRAQAARALRHLRDDASVPALAQALADADESVRRESAQALAVHGAEQAEADLCAALGDGSSDVRYLAAYALRRVKTPAARKALQAQLARETNAATRLELEKALR